MVLKFALAAFYALVMVGVLWMAKWGPMRTYSMTVSMIVLGVAGVLVDVYGVCDANCLWKCSIDRNGTMIVY